jgi:hypothetical protein
MRCSIKKAIAAIALMALASAPAVAQIATFDDLPGTGGLTPVPFGYAVPGMQWYNWYVVTGAETGTACDVSHPNCAYNGFGTPNSLFESSTPFDFDSGYFTAWYRSEPFCGYGCTVDLTVSGWLNGVLVGTMDFTLSGPTPSLLTFNYDNVNLVIFDTHGTGNWFLADNLAFNNATAVPEPASLALLATGLVGLFPTLKRKFTK